MYNHIELLSFFDNQFLQVCRGVKRNILTTSSDSKYTFFTYELVFDTHSKYKDNVNEGTKQLRSLVSSDLVFLIKDVSRSQKTDDGNYFSILVTFVIGKEELLELVN